MMRARRIRPELLDQLSPLDPAGQGSRRDLRRLNTVMGSARILAGALRSVHRPGPRSTLIELGGGDGWLMLNVARRLGPGWRGTRLQLVDKWPVAAAEVDAGFAALGWELERIQAEAITWMEEAASGPGVVVANLFLHHVENGDLARMFSAIGGGGIEAVIALEPRRSRTAHLLSRWVGLLGCNAVTRNDAVLSVEAGFRCSELSRLWAEGPGWRLREHSAGLFSHLFVACREMAYEGAQTH